MQGTYEQAGPIIHRVRVRGDRDRRDEVRAGLERVDWPQLGADEHVFVRQVRARAGLAGLPQALGERVRHSAAGAVLGSAGGACGDCQAVRFTSLTHLLACLSLDLVSGRAPGLWYWQRFSDLFDRPRGEAISELWCQHRAGLPALAQSLAADGVLAGCLDVMGGQGAQRVLAGIQALGVTAGGGGQASPPDALPTVALSPIWPRAVRGLSQSDPRRALVANLALRRARPHWFAAMDGRRLQGLALGALAAAESAGQPPMRPPTSHAGARADAGAGAHVAPDTETTRPADFGPAEEIAQVSASAGRDGGEGGRSGTPGAAAIGAAGVGQVTAAAANDGQPICAGAADGQLAFNMAGQVGDCSAPGESPPAAAADFANPTPAEAGARSPTITSRVPEAADVQTDLSAALASPQPSQAWSTSAGGLFLLIPWLATGDAQALLHRDADTLALPSGWCWPYRVAIALGLEPDAGIQACLTALTGLSSPEDLRGLPALACESELVSLGQRRFGPRGFWGPRLLQRAAVIEATRTHVDVHYDAAEVDVEVRLAGLDLDPGFVPWLGQVVHFHYGRHPSLPRPALPEPARRGPSGEGEEHRS